MFKAGTASLAVPGPNTKCIAASEQGDSKSQGKGPVQTECLSISGQKGGESQLHVLSDQA